GRNKDHLALTGLGTESSQRIVNMLVGIIGSGVAAGQSPSGGRPRHSSGLHDFCLIAGEGALNGFLRSNAKRLLVVAIFDEISLVIRYFRKGMQVVCGGRARGNAIRRLV